MITCRRLQPHHGIQLTDLEFNDVARQGNHGDTGNHGEHRGWKIPARSMLFTLPFPRDLRGSPCPRGYLGKDETHNFATEGH